MAESIALIPVFTGTINNQSVQLCDARTMHTFMGVLRDFSNWIKGRIRKFKFVEGVDYLLAKTGEQLPSGTKYSIDYHLTLDMAKELAMVENNDKGREARRYFIACEKQAQLLSNPEQLPSSLSPYSVHPGQTLSEEQAQTLRKMLEDSVKTLPKEERAIFMVRGWGKLKAHFNVSYRKIPSNQFDEAVSIIARHIIEHSATQAIPAQQQLPLQAHEQPATVIDKERIRLAIAAASEVAAKVQERVFEAMLEGEDCIDHGIFGIKFYPVEGSKTKLAPEVFELTLGQLSTEIAAADWILATDYDVASLAAACSIRLAKGFAKNQS